MTTSLSDYPGYRELCRLAADNPVVFASFRREHEYRQIVETVERSAGRDYLRIAMRQAADFKTCFQRFQTSDAVGGPRRYRYWLGPFESYRFAPTTLRYIKMASDLRRFFGGLDGMRILEIGGGYGGFCKIVADLWRFHSYHIADLPEPIELARKFLGHFAVPNVEFIDAGSDARWRPKPAYDLIISTYAFSELSRPMQEFYFDRAVAAAPRGYMMWNFLTDDMPVASMGLAEFTELVRPARVLDDAATLIRLDRACGNKLVVWAHAPGSKGFAS